MTVAQDKMSTVEFITNGVTDKIAAGKAACSSDTVKEASNIVGFIRINGSHSDSTGNRREVPVFVGETAPTGEYANAPNGSIFIQVGTTGAMYLMVASAWVAVTHA